MRAKQYKRGDLLQLSPKYVQCRVLGSIEKVDKFTRLQTSGYLQTEDIAICLEEQLYESPIGSRLNYIMCLTQYGISWVGESCFEKIQ